MREGEIKAGGKELSFRGFTVELLRIVRLPEHGGRPSFELELALSTTVFIGPEATLEFSENGQPPRVSLQPDSQGQLCYRLDPSNRPGTGHFRMLISSTTTDNASISNLRIFTTLSPEGSIVQECLTLVHVGQYSIGCTSYDVDETD